MSLTSKEIKLFVNVERKVLCNIFGRKEELEDLLTISDLGQGRKYNTNAKIIGGGALKEPSGFDER